ncbi:MAG: TonB-dependent receptor plug domain-containing protein [Luteitalea sp.]|nr:TonB-dependent receptor plug domain-containing protein [Luteitalea sp.]
MYHRSLCIGALVWMVATTASPAVAQTTTGGLVGVVRDSDGGVVPGATVAARHVGTNALHSAVTGGDGQYVLRGLPVGPYDVTVELEGFKSFRTDNVLVRVNDEVRLDATLEVGDVTESVTVAGLARTVDTVTGTLKTIVDQTRIEELPLNGRNPTQLMLLVPGTQADTRTSLTSGTTYPGVEAVSSNGARGNTTNYVLDGGSNNDHYSNSPNPMPNPDALQEFSVQTNSFSAEYGRNVGAVVNAVTRAGTNQLHGLLFEYLRHHELNATNFFTPGVDDGLKRNQFGGTLGGPIARDRAFFFFSYQGTRLRSRPATSTELVPTEAQRLGDFSALDTQLRNPLTGAPYPNNQIPLGDMNPAALQVVNEWLPLPNGGPDQPNLLRFAVPERSDDDQWLGRVDYQLSDRHRLYGRVWVSRASVPAILETGNIFTSSFGRTWQNTIVSANDTWIITPRLLNNLVVTFNRTNNDNFQIYPPDYPSLGINVYNDATPQWVFNVDGYFGINTGDTNQFLRNEFQIADTVRWTTDRHELALGLDYSYGQGDIVNNFRANGRFTFSSGAPFSGDALADFLLGRFSSFEQGVGEFKNTRMHFLAAFVQDTFHVNRRLTLNLGLRWDPFFPFTDVNDHLACYRLGEQSSIFVNAPEGALYPGDPGCPRGGYDAAWLNLGPRLGAAWDLSGDGRTSLRTGYGIFYDRPNTISTNSPANQGPFGTVVRFDGDVTDSVTNPYAGRVNPFPVDPFDVPRGVEFVLPHNVFSYADDLRNGRLQSWHVTLERELWPSWLARVAYAGSHADQLAIIRELNPAIYEPGATTATTNERRPLYPELGNILSVEATGQSTYHALQLTLDKRLAEGFSVLASYTLSKSLDDSSENKQTGATATNPFDPHFDWGPANFDRRHRFVTSWLWELPGQFESPALRGVLAGWSLTGIVTLQSGLPFSVTSGEDNARSGTGGQRADIEGDASLPDDRSRAEQIEEWFNTDVFVANALGTFGNSGRNAFHGPGYANVDLGLHKRFAIGNHVGLEARVEAFNVLNRVNLDLPEANLSSSNVGRIVSAGDSRIMQVALRVSF